MADAVFNENQKENTTGTVNNKVVPEETPNDNGDDGEKI